MNPVPILFLLPEDKISPIPTMSASPLGLATLMLVLGWAPLSRAGLIMLVT